MITRISYPKTWRISSFASRRRSTATYTSRTWNWPSSGEILNRMKLMDSGRKLLIDRRTSLRNLSKQKPSRRLTIWKIYRKRRKRRRMRERLKKAVIGLIRYRRRQWDLNKRRAILEPINSRETTSTLIRTSPQMTSRKDAERSSTTRRATDH